MDFEYSKTSTFFRPKVQNRIRAQQKTCCILCTNYLDTKDGVCVPIIQDPATKIRSESMYFTDSGFDINQASNGILSCKRCCRFLARSDNDQERRVLLIPCLPILVYIDSILRKLHSKDLVHRTQTIDQIIEDLERRPSSTAARRAASPFLHYFQLQPVGEFSPSAPEGFSELTLYNYNSRATIHDKTYRVFNAAGVPFHDVGFTMHMSIHEQPATGGIDSLWYIPGRSTGAFLALAMSVGPARAGNLDLYDALRSVLHHSTAEERGFLRKPEITRPQVTLSTRRLSLHR